MTTYARTETRTAPLSSDFAREFLGRRFSAAVVEALYAAIPTYTKGPRKGLPKGFVQWTKVVSGGWYKGDSLGGRVLRPGTHEVCVMLGSVTLLDEAGVYSSDEARIKGIADQLAIQSERAKGRAA